MNLPLHGIRVMELGSFIAVPYAASILASLGAEVVKVEPLPPGDPFRRGRDADDQYFAQYNAGKKSLSADLKNARGRVVVERLLKTCDVLIHNLRPGKAEKLGLGYEQVAPGLPRLVYAAISGFGNLGPLGRRPGYDSAAQSMSGLYALLAREGEFQATGLPLADNTTGVVAALGVCARLAGRVRSGVGGLVETSLLEVATMLANGGALGSAVRSGTGYSVRSQVYCLECADGRPVTVALGDSDELWSTLSRLVADRSQGRLDLLTGPGWARYRDRLEDYEAIRGLLQEYFKEVDAADAVAALRYRGIPATLVQSYRESVIEGDAAGLLQKCPGTVDLVRLGLSFGETRTSRIPVVPRVGEHTRALLADLRMNDETTQLEAVRAVYCVPEK